MKDEKFSLFFDGKFKDYSSGLDNWCAEIKKDANIIPEKYQRLAQLNDYIVKELEEYAKTLEDKKDKKELGIVFRNTKPEVFYDSEIVEKGFKKIRGYPGDFEMMNYVYNNVICSKNIIGKYFDRYQLDTGYSQAVRGRKNKMVQILTKYINEVKNKSISILNLPCGPARDIQELLGNMSLQKSTEVHIVCVDQDNEALDFAKKSIVNQPENVSIFYKQGNILNYVRHPEKHKEELGSFDLVYSIGLADYLPDKLLQNMIKFSWSLLKDNGQLIYAFKIENKDPFAPLPPKWFCDWQFEPRSTEQCLKLIKETGIEGYLIDNEEWEESGRVCFFKIRKK